jgi:hypothetical protein
LKYHPDNFGVLTSARNPGWEQCMVGCGAALTWLSSGRTVRNDTGSRRTLGRSGREGNTPVDVSVSLLRNDEKPFRIESSTPGGFRARANRSYQRVNGCYCVLARAGDSGGLGNKVSQMKGAEKRDKVSTRTGKDTGSRQGP